jgi:hypothetical protein
VTSLVTGRSTYKDANESGVGVAKQLIANAGEAIQETWIVSGAHAFGHEHIVAKQPLSLDYARKQAPCVVCASC